MEDNLQVIILHWSRLRSFTSNNPFNGINGLLKIHFCWTLGWAKHKPNHSTGQIDRCPRLYTKISCNEPHTLRNLYSMWRCSKPYYTFVYTFSQSDSEYMYSKQAREPMDSIPWIGWDTRPRIVDRTSEYSRANRYDFLNNWKVQPYTLCLRAGHTTGSQGPFKRLVKWFLKKTFSRTWKQQRTLRSVQYIRKIFWK